jgi:periplasmic protein CpxP/Spy
MKKIQFLTLLAICLFTMAAFAQQNPPAKEGEGHKHAGQQMGNVDDHVKELSAKLNLTADQQAKVKTILQDTHQQVQTVMKDESLSKDDKHARMKALHESVQAKVREVLNDDQKPKFDAMMKDMETNMHGHGDQDHK